MLNNARWLFFDMGYTLIDEDACWRQRAEDTVVGSAVNSDVLLSAMADHAAAGRDPYPYTLEEFGMEEMPWPLKQEVPYPDAIPVLRALHEKYKIGIISNQAPGIAERLYHFGLLDLIDSVASSSELRVAKPDPRLFLLALAQAGCMPADAVMIGDRLDNDIGPARLLGMGTVWIRQGFGRMGRPGPGTTPDAVVQKLPELLQIL